MNKKFVLLLLALVLPVLVFIFLKLFGKNEFVVEPMFQTRVEKLPSECPEVTLPYFIPDSTYNYIKQGRNEDSLLIIFFERMSGDLNTSETQLIRLQESFKTDNGIGLERLSNSEKTLECSLLLQPPMDLVLVDSRKRIRGQYNSNDRDDVDRLMTELDIILKKY